MKAKTEVYEALSVINYIIYDNQLSDEHKLSGILSIIEEYGLNELTFYKASADNEFKRMTYHLQLFEGIGACNYDLTFMSEIIDTNFQNGSILFEIILN